MKVLLLLFRTVLELKLPAKLEKCFSSSARKLLFGVTGLLVSREAEGVVFINVKEKSQPQSFLASGKELGGRLSQPFACRFCPVGGTIEGSLT